MKKLLLTGADGFTGVHLSALAEKNGFVVFPLVSDITNRSAMAEEVSAIAPTHVCHLAAISAVTHADEAAFYQVNLFGTLNLLNALCELPVRPQKVLLASSANVYGNVDSSSIEECVCPKPVNHYSMSKLAMEHMALNYLDRLPILITRPFNYTGVGHDDRFVIPKIVDHFARKAKSIELGNLEVEREYNDVRMVCDAYLKLLSAGEPGEIYNVCSGRSYGLGSVLALMKELTGCDMDINVNPAFARANEVKKLSGSPAKLQRTIGSLEQRTLDETLRWMLASKSSQ